MPSSHLILCHPLLLLPPIPPSIRVFSNESALHMRWPKYWSFTFSISPSKEHPGLISFRIDWLDLLVVQGTLKSLFQHHSLKASIFRHSAFFTVQLSHPYMTTGKTIAFTRWTFVGKVMSLLFNEVTRILEELSSGCPVVVAFGWGIHLKPSREEMDNRHFDLTLISLTNLLEFSPLNKFNQKIDLKSKLQRHNQHEKWIRGGKKKKVREELWY